MSSPAGVSRPRVVVIGGDCCGLAAAYDLGRRGGVGRCGVIVSLGVCQSGSREDDSQCVS